MPQLPALNFEKDVGVREDFSRRRVLENDAQVKEVTTRNYIRIYRKNIKMIHSRFYVFYKNNDGYNEYKDFSQNNDIGINIYVFRVRERTLLP